MGYVLVISWISGIVLSILFGIGAWIAKDKEAYRLSGIFLLITIFTGFISTIPLVCAFILIGLNKRFD